MRRPRNTGINFLFGANPKQPRTPPAPTRHERQEHQGRVPQVGVPSGPRQTVAPAPSSPAAGMPVAPHVPGTTRPTTTPSGSTVLNQISDLLTPGPSVKETAEAAHRLGVRPQDATQGIAGGIGAAASSLVHTASHGVNEISKDVAELPKQRVHSFLGRKTLGTPTVAQVAGAAIKGQTRVNQRGRLTVPATRHAAQNLLTARRRAANSGQIVGPLTPGQKVFVKQVARETGLSPRVIAAQALAEESGGAAASREAEGNHNWLNIGYFDSGPGALTHQSAWSTPESAAKATSEFFKGQKYGPSPGIAAIVPTSAGKSDQAQMSAIARSGWASSAYGGSLAGTYGQVGVKPTNPAVLADLKQAKGQAAKLGIPTRAGDVEPGPAPKTVFVRADAVGMVQWAKALLGTQEGSRLQLKWAAQSGVSAAEPWCSEFIAAGMTRRGLPAPANPAYSGTWLTWKGGSNIGNNLQQAKPGDIIVFGPASSTAHVGLYIGNGQMISGNYGNEVAQAPVSQETASEPIAGIVRPHFQGGKVAVKESTVLPGAAIGPGGQLVSGPAGVGGGEVAGQQSARPAPARALGSVPISPLLATTTPLPEAFGGGSGESLSPEEANDIVSQILRRKRL